MKKQTFSFLMLICFPFLLYAQWTDNSVLNTEISDTIGMQVQPKVIVNPDNGESYISWFSNTANNQFDVYLQRLDVDGNKLWTENGLLISDHPTMTWTTDYDIVIDNEGCAVLVTQDLRTGYSDVYAYRISPDGGFLWGDDGIALSNDQGFDPSPKAVITQDGNIVFAWAAEPADTTQFDKISLQKVSLEGQLLWGNNVIISQDSTHCMMPHIIPTEDNSIIAVWIESANKDTTAVGSWPYMYPYSQKINSDGNFDWTNKVAIDTLDNMPLKYFNPSITSNGDGGIFISWMAFPPWGQVYSCYVQHVNSDGMAQWTLNGVNVSDSIQYEHALPKLTYLPQDDLLFVFWNEFRQYSGTDVRCAIFGQKFSNSGEKLWTAEGKMFEGWYDWFDTLTSITGICPTTDDDFTVFFEKEYWELTPDTIMITNYHAMRIDEDGNFIWDDEKPNISSASSTKFSMAFSGLFYNQWITAWSDNRNDPEFENKTGIYAQNMSIDGNIGPLSINDNKIVSSGTAKVYPNPFTQNTTIEYTVQNNGPVKIELLDMHGQQIKTLFDGYKQMGTHQLPMNSFGLTPGIYFIELTSNGKFSYQKIIIAR